MLMNISILKSIDEVDEVLSIEVFSNVSEQEATPKIMLLVSEGHCVQIEKTEQ